MASSSQNPSGPAIAGPIMLANLPKDFSFATYLDHGRQKNQFRKILHNEKLLHPTHIIALGLTEIGRSRSHGFFLYLDLSCNDSDGHPCDILFLNKEWTQQAAQHWDVSDWTNRFQMMALANNLGIWDGEQMIPINARILNVSLNSGVERIQTPETDPFPNAGLTSTSEPPESHLSLNVYMPSRSDALGTLGTVMYVRLVEDISTLLVHWPKRGNQPYVCEKVVAEDPIFSDQFVVPEKRSQIFVRFKNSFLLNEAGYDYVRKIRNRNLSYSTSRDKVLTTDSVFTQLTNAWNNASDVGADADTASIIRKWSEIKQALGPNYRSLDDRALHDANTLHHALSIFGKMLDAYDADQ